MATKGSSSVISVGGYVGTMLLFVIPVVGLVICIIMAIKARNENKRNFARATLVMVLIGIVLTVVMSLLSRGAVGMLSGLPFFF